MANATAADATPPWCCLFEKMAYGNAFLIYGHIKIVSNMPTFVVVFLLSSHGLYLVCDYFVLNFVGVQKYFRHGLAHVICKSIVRS